MYAEKNDWPTPGDHTTFYFAQDGVGAALRCEMDELHRRAINGEFMLRRPANNLDGLLGPFVAAGDCLDPLLPAGCIQYFDPDLQPVDGDVCLVEWSEQEREAIQTEYQNAARAIEKYRDVPTVNTDGLQNFVDQYESADLTRAVKVFRRIDGRELLLANNSCWSVEDALIVGVLRHVRIDGRPRYGSGMSDAEINEHVAALSSMDRRPKATTLNGTPVFLGSNPPTSPKVGWLWRDTDTNIVFRWDGDSWDEYSIASGIITEQIFDDAVTSVLADYVASHSESSLGTSWLLIDTAEQPVDHVIQVTASCDAWTTSSPAAPYLELIATPTAGGPPFFSSIERPIQATASPGERLTFQLEIDADSATEYTVRLAAGGATGGTIEVRDATLRVVHIKK